MHSRLDDYAVYVSHGMCTPNLSLLRCGSFASPRAACGAAAATRLFVGLSSPSTSVANVFTFGLLSLTVHFQLCM